MRSTEIAVHTGSRRGLFDITAECERFVAGGGDGLLNVFVPHATAGVVVMELGAGVGRRTCWRPSSGSCRTTTDGAIATAHRVTARTTCCRCWSPPSVTIPVRDGRLRLGTWQSIAVLDTNADNTTRTVVLTLQDG